MIPNKCEYCFSQCMLIQQKWLQVHLGWRFSWVAIWYSSSSKMCGFLVIKGPWLCEMTHFWEFRERPHYLLKQLKTGLVFARPEIFLSKTWSNPHDEWTQSRVSECQITPWALITILCVLAFIMATPMLFLAGKASTFSILPPSLWSKIVFQLNSSHLILDDFPSLILSVWQKRGGSSPWEESEVDW